MPQASLEPAQTVSLNMRELRGRLLGFDRDEYAGNWVLRIGGLGNVYVNRNVVRRFDGIEGVLKAPDNWLASIRMNGEAWLFRVASPQYVDVPAEDVVNAVKSVLPGITSFGKWEAERVWVEEGATYGSITGLLGSGNHPQIGDFVYLVRVTWGDDGFSAFKVFKAIGILKCFNGLVMGVNEFRRIFHSRLTGPIEEKVRDVLNRIRNAISTSMDTSALERLAKTPIEPKTVEELGRRFSDFTRLYNEYKPQYGDTLLTAFQALGWIATHGSNRNADRAVSSMTRLLASLN